MKAIKILSLSIAMLLGSGALTRASIFSMVGQPSGVGQPPGIDPWVFNFDENGNGSINIDNGGFTPLMGSLQPDPSNGGANALIYVLPSAVGNGDISVLDATGAISDLVRFTDANGGLTGVTANLLIFYSLPGGGDLADTGIPSNIGTGATGPPVNEAPDGSFTFGSPNVYNGLSSGTVTIPEPSTLILAGVGSLGLVGYRYRRRRRATA